MIPVQSLKKLFYEISEEMGRWWKKFPHSCRKKIWIRKKRMLKMTSVGEASLVAVQPIPPPTDNDQTKGVKERETAERRNDEMNFYSFFFSLFCIVSFLFIFVFFPQCLILPLSFFFSLLWKKKRIHFFWKKKGFDFVFSLNFEFH